MSRYFMQSGVFPGVIKELADSTRKISEAR